MFDEDPNDQAKISGADLAQLVDELKASKQRELELLAVIDNARAALYDQGMYEVADLLFGAPAQALREHEAKVLEDVIRNGRLDESENAYLQRRADRLRMAEERRKK